VHKKPRNTAGNAVRVVNGFDSNGCCDTEERGGFAPDHVSMVLALVGGRTTLQLCLSHLSKIIHTGQVREVFLACCYPQASPSLRTCRRCPPFYKACLALISTCLWPLLLHCRRPCARKLKTYQRYVRCGWLGFDPTSRPSRIHSTHPPLSLPPPLRHPTHRAQCPSKTSTSSSSCSPVEGGREGLVGERTLASRWGMGGGRSVRGGNCRRTYPCIPVGDGWGAERSGREL
jgi:hypothetical protein